MAVFTSILTRQSADTLRASTTLTDPLFVIVNQGIVITNTKTSTSKTYASAIDITVAGTKTVDCVASSPFASTFPDGVYTGVWTLDDESSEYTSSSRLLITSGIDASIAAYTATTAAQKANLVWMNYMREQVQVAFDAVDNTKANALIGRIQATLASIQLDQMGVMNASLTNRSTISMIVTNTLSLITPLNASSNYIQNTLTGELASYEDDFMLATASGSTIPTSSDVFNIPFFEDGVHFIYAYAGENYTESPINLAVAGSAVVVITTIQEQFETFKANYDPNNTEQAAAYAQMLSDFAEIESLSTTSTDTVNNFSAINTLIEEIQDSLALFVDVTATLTLTDKSNLLITLNGSNLPNVTYSTQALTLSNTNDNTQEYIVEDAFPLNYVDLTETLNSDTINFGSQYADGVYQMNVSWDSANEMMFNAQAYCLVTTQIDCGIAKIIAKHPTCKVLTSRLNEIMTYRRIIDKSFENADYNSTNFYINLCLNLLTKSGCNCGC
jgi:hypothetical protein